MTVVGVDTGGTFTDVVDDGGAVVKVLSAPDDPTRAVATGLAGRHPDLLCHGTTVATNALLERRGAEVALVTNEGFADLIEIARQDRPALYDPWADRPEPLVRRELRLEVGGRLDAAGHEIAPVGGAPAVPAAVEAVAVCLLHADLNPAHEQVVAGELAARGLDVTRSSEVAPEFREYERMVTTVVNAYLRPACRPYVRRLGELAGEVLVMTSAGGLVPTDEAAELPVALLLSGPAGGVRAAAAAAAAAGFADAVSFDMGGTSTDVCLVLGADPEPAPGRTAAGFPIRLPALDIHTIGAGGGSIAGLDPGGALAVGPRSAGADPGPACYGRGGTEPTVTDADLVLGRIPADATFGDLGALDHAAARSALEKAGLTAEGVVDVVDAAMERAVRLVTVERGVDPSSLALVAFGGAGPLHACAVAAALGMAAVVVPPRAGVLSATPHSSGWHQSGLLAALEHARRRCRVVHRGRGLGRRPDQLLAAVSLVPRLALGLRLDRVVVEVQVRCRGRGLGGLIRIEQRHHPQPGGGAVALAEPRGVVAKPQCGRVARELGRCDRAQDRPKPVQPRCAERRQVV